MNHNNILKPLKSKDLSRFDFIGFDVETTGKENIFYMGGVYYYTKSGKEVYKDFWDKESLIKELLSRKNKNKLIVATNLNFDLLTTFYNSPYWDEINILFQQSNIIFATHKNNKIKFIDTFNYLKVGVEELGKILGYPKLEKPSFLGEKCGDKKEVSYLREYNKRDCKISCDFMYFLQEGIIKAGGKLRITNASCSFDIWRRNFLKRTLVKEKQVLKDEKIRDYLFSCYFGGRTEVFKRGTFKNVYYYDINSLYPSVMINKYPLPNSIKKGKCDIRTIEKYEGFSYVYVKTPENMKKPLLPLKKDGKLLFPLGSFYGWYNHNLLRKAIELGYKIIEIGKQYYYEKTFYPFKEFVEYFYEKRLEYKKQGSNMEIIMKLFLNSLYGKFGQKEINVFKEIKGLGYGPEKQDKLEKMKDVQVINKKVIYNKTEAYVKNNVFPVFASYTTSYALIKMYDYLNNDGVIYTDTDSILTTKPLNINSKKLGEMKLEGFYKYAVVVKPKIYKLSDEKPKIKGVPLKKDNNNIWCSLLKKEVIKYQKFVKFKEAIRRGLKPNEIIIQDKVIDLEDNKRVWTGSFNPLTKQDSNPRWLRL